MAPSTDSSPSEARRQALASWMRANDVSPKDIPLDSEFTVTTGDDGSRTIHYTTYVRDDDGILVGNDRLPMTTKATVPCVAEPPTWLNIPGAECPHVNVIQEPDPVDPPDRVPGLCETCGTNLIGNGQGDWKPA